MSTLQAALLKAGVTSSVIGTTEAQPDLSRFEHKPLEIVEREMLWTGVVQMKVPANARLTTAETDNGPIEYLQFGMMVKGGFVNVHVRANKPKQFASKNVVARAELRQKNSKDGRSFLYIDLFPTTEAPTHQIKVVGEAPKMPWAKDVTLFETPVPLKGMVAVVEHDKNFH